MTVLVTGSAGHLGEAVMRYLRAAGRSSLGLDVKPSPFTDQVGSICDKRFVTRCIRSAQAVVHAATLHKPHVATPGRTSSTRTSRERWFCSRQLWTQASIVLSTSAPRARS